MPKQKTPFKTTNYQKSVQQSGGTKVGGTEGRIRAPEPHSGVRGLRHGPLLRPRSRWHMARQASTRDSACGPPPAAGRPSPPRRPGPGLPATPAPGARPARDPPRLSPKGAGPCRRTPEACVAVGAGRGPRAPALIPAPQDGRGGLPGATGQKLEPRRRPGRAPRLTQQGAGQGAAAIAPRSSGPPAASAAPAPRPPHRELRPRPSPLTSELPTAVETRTQAQEGDWQSGGCLFSRSLPAPHAGLHTAPHTPLRTALLRLAHASNQRREPGWPIRTAREERGPARGRQGAGRTPPPRPT